MYALPAVMSPEVATASMGTLHRNLSWLVVLFAMIVISVGFIELRRTQIELTAGITTGKTYMGSAKFSDRSSIRHEIDKIKHTDHHQS